MKVLKRIWNIITFKDLNFDGKVDIKDKLIKAKKDARKKS